TACRIEHAKSAKIGKCFAQFADVFACGIDALTPRPDDCRSDHFANVELAREMRTECMTLFLVHTVLKQRPEYFRTHFAPVVESSGFMQAIRLRPLQFNWIDFQKQSAVKVLNVLETPATRGFLTLHLTKQPAE